MIRVALIDDQTLVREGIRSLLALSDAVEVVAEAANGENIAELISSTRPDVALVDLQMPKVNGIETVKLIGASAMPIPVIILTTFDDQALVVEAIQAGAKGYLLKDTSLESLVAAIESVANGETFVQPSITESLLKGLKNVQPSFDALPEPDNLSSKEIEILRFMASGYANKEISNLLNKSEGTVKNQVSNILSKLGVRDRTRAVLRAIELEIL